MISACATRIPDCTTCAGDDDDPTCSACGNDNLSDDMKACVGKYCNVLE